MLKNILKTISKNELYPIKINKLMGETLKKSYKNKSLIKKRCIYTNRSKGNLTKLKISRIKLREYEKNGYLLNIHKYTW